MNTKTTAITPHEVSVIPATKRSVRNGGQLKESTNLRIAAYCRVSTGDESQQTSYTKQKEFYTGLINGKEGWMMAGIYADEALSGTSRTRRVQFNKMIEDAMGGRIDYIVTKSISRFARNTVDTLECVRQLRQQNPPVGIYFEKENIDTLDAKGELVLTILSALAQDESRSLSDNIRWTFQKNFKNGKPMINLKLMLGYDSGPNGEWVINPEQAEIVRFIFERFLCGESANRIAQKLNKQGKKTVRNNSWTSGAVYIVLRNEKYVGDCAMQKTITKNFLTHQSTVNKGEAPMYYVKDHHVGIISRTTWDRTQIFLQAKAQRKREQAKRNTDKAKVSPISRANSVLDNLYCSHCGSKLVRVSYTTGATNYTDDRCMEKEGVDGCKYRERYSFNYSLYRCGKKHEARRRKQAEERGKPNEKLPNGKISAGEKKQMEAICPSESIYEIAVRQSFMEMLYAVRVDYLKNGDESEIVRMFRAAYAETCRKEKNTTYSRERMELIEAQLKELEASCDRAVAGQAEAIRAAMETGAAGESSEEAAATEEAKIYAGLAADLTRRMGEMKEEMAVLASQQSESLAMEKNFALFLNCLKELPDVNNAGMRLNVNGLDTERGVFADRYGNPGNGLRGAFNSGHFKVSEEVMRTAPDFMEFTPGIYFAFISRGDVMGDTIVYKTTFGVKLVSTGNSRKFGDFFGFRKAAEDGSAELLTENWQVNGRKVQYMRKKRNIFVENGKRFK